MAKFNKKLLKALSENSIDRLDLSEEELSSEIIEQLVEALEKNQSLVIIKLTNCDLTNEYLEKLAPAFSQISTLRELYLNNNPFTLNGVKALALAIGNIPLRIIDLSDTQMGDLGVAEFSKFIQKNKTLIQLKIDNFASLKKIKISGIGFLCEAIKFHPTIQYVDLTGNLIEDEGCKSIAELLKVTKSIAFLDISWNKISFLGAETIADGLRANTTLHSLELRHNQISSGALNLIKAATAATQLPLYYMDISNNLIRSQTIEQMFLQLANNEQLCMLQLVSIASQASPLEKLTIGLNVLSTNPNSKEIIRTGLNDQNELIPAVLKNINIKTKANFNKQKKSLESSLIQALVKIDYPLKHLATVSRFYEITQDLVQLFYRVDSQWVEACLQKVPADLIPQIGLIDPTVVLDKENKNDFPSDQSLPHIDKAIETEETEEVIEVELTDSYQAADAITAKILQMLTDNENLYQVYQNAESKELLLTMIISYCEDHSQWGELKEKFSTFSNKKIEEILMEGISLGISAWKTIYADKELPPLVEVKTKSTEVLPLNLSLSINSAKSFPEALEVLLDWVKLSNFKNILESARANRKSTLIKTVSYLKNLGDDDTAISRFIQTISSEEIWLLAKNLNWYRTPGLICQQALSKLGFVKPADWFSALGTELKEAYDAYQQIELFFKSFQDNASGTPNYDKLILTFLYDAALYDVLQRYQKELIELFAAAGIPGFDHEAAKEAITLLLTIQAKIIELPSHSDSIVSLGIQLCHDQTEQFGEWLQKIGLLVKRLYLVIQAYTEPKAASMADFIQLEVKTLFTQASQWVAMLDDKHRLVHIETGNNTTVFYLDCKKLFTDYLDGRLGSLLSRVVTTNKADAIRALDLRGLSFVGSTKDNLYKLEKFALCGFDFRNAVFINCSFKKSLIRNSKFDNTVWNGVVDLSGLSIDAFSALSLCDALAKALEETNIIIIGKMILIGEFKDISLSLSDQYYDTQLAKNFDLKLQEKDLPESQNNEVREEKTQTVNKDKEEEATPENSTGFMTNFYFGMKSLMANASNIPSSVMDCINTSMDFIGKVVETGEMGFSDDFDQQEDQLMLCFENELEAKIAEIKKQAQAELQQEATALKKQVGAVAKSQASHLKSQERLNHQIKALEEHLKPISQYWKAKEKIKKERAFLEKSGKEVAIYFKTLRAELCSAFYAIFILRTDFIKREEGTANSFKAGLSKGSTVANVTNIGASVINPIANNLDAIASGVSKAGTFLGSACLKLASSKIIQVGNAVPILGVATTAAKMAADFAVATLDKRALAAANHQLLGFTPKLLEKLADEIARRLTFIYFEQINLLTLKSAERFAECSVGRILTGLFNDKIHGDSFVEDSLLTVRTYDVKQAKIKWEALQLSFGIPLRHERLKTKFHTKVTEDKLHRKAGIYLETKNEKIYFSNDAGKANFDAKVGKTYADEVGYIKLESIPLNMTRDNPKRELKIQNIPIQTVVENEIPVPILEDKLLQENPQSNLEKNNSTIIHQLSKENAILRQQALNLSKNMQELQDQLQQLMSSLVTALPSQLYDKSVKNSPKTLTNEQIFLKNLYSKLTQLKLSNQVSPAKQESNPKSPPSAKLVGSSLSRGLTQSGQATPPSRRISPPIPKTTEEKEEKNVKEPDYERLMEHK